MTPTSILLAVWVLALFALAARAFHVGTASRAVRFVAGALLVAVAATAAVVVDGSSAPAGVFASATLAAILVCLLVGVGLLVHAARGAPTHHVRP